MKNEERIVDDEDGVTQYIEGWQAPTVYAELPQVVAESYGVPVEGVRIDLYEIERHRDTCDGNTVNGSCVACDRDTHYEVVTLSYPGRARGVHAGPFTTRWHSTWGRLVGAPTFELYAD